jgi:hypothetical protein
LYNSRGMASDGTYLYVVDGSYNRIMKFKISDGSYIGWIGGISSNPTSGTCSGSSGSYSGTGWCKGGQSVYSSPTQSDGYMSSPTGIYHNLGHLYVADSGFNRVSKYNASTGQFEGWIGKIGTTPNVGSCTPSGGYSSSGWCTGGTATSGSHGAEPGGGFSGISGITGSGNYLYVSGGSTNNRVDKFDLNGVWQGAIRPKLSYSGPFTQNTSTISTWGQDYNDDSNNVWTDGTNLYAAQRAGIVVKRDLATGTVLGWKGWIASGGGNSTTGGEAGCTGANGQMTPGWCTGGGPTTSTTFGGFSSPQYITGDSDFIYVTDDSQHRVIRLPK